MEKNTFNIFYTFCILLLRIVSITWINIDLHRVYCIDGSVKLNNEPCTFFIDQHLLTFSLQGCLLTITLLPNLASKRNGN